ncbi:MAG: hypothetical protein JJ879_10015 [Sneathiella sp.]|nr:hypothetical protein [Sneathiella sp.]
METRAIRPINCEPDLMKAFIGMVEEGGEVPAANLIRGVPMAEMLFFTIDENKNLMGVSALRYPNARYHKHLFDKAGIPEMYNPLSLEVCWLYVAPAHRGKNVWKHNSETRLKYLGNRPAHGIHRSKNIRLNDFSSSTSLYKLVGNEFTPEMSETPVRIITINHDPVFNPSKRIYYGFPPEST